jgi:serine/threonine-protein phosphatase 2A regulatory subunit B''
LVAEDFLPLMEDVVLHHPGLQFLSSLPLFQERYVETVICRIFYSMNRVWTGRITLSELKKSRFLSVLHALEETDDINLVCKRENLFPTIIFKLMMALQSSVESSFPINTFT